MKAILSNLLFRHREVVANSAVLERESCVVNAADAPIDQQPDGWFKISPYGVFNGSVPGRLQHFGEPQARAMVEEFNSFRGRAGRLFRGIPIYIGHPDVDPKRWTDDRRLGKVVDLQARADGLYGLGEWNSLGTENRQQEYWIYPSPRWDAPAGRKNFEPDRLISIGLTNTPRIPTSEPVWNSDDPLGTEAVMNRNALTTKLNLPAEATDEEILAAIEALQSASAMADTKKAEAAEAATAKEEAENSLRTATARVSELEGQVTALRESHDNSLLDSAVAAGKISKAERADYAAKLAGDKREETINAITALKPKLKTDPLDLTKTREEVENANLDRDKRREAIANAVDAVQTANPHLSRDEARFRVKRDPKFKHLFEVAAAE